MTAYAALLRAVNVGGTGKLPMKDLAALCEKAGFEEVRTYIQSGNVVFRSKLREASVKTTLERELARYMKKPVTVLVRTHVELAAIVRANPFMKAPPNRVLVYFLDEKLSSAKLGAKTGPDGETLVARGREVFIHYPNMGQGASKLKLPFASDGTARNVNTVTKLVELTEALA